MTDTGSRAAVPGDGWTIPPPASTDGPQAAGWFSDPLTFGQLRWWTGSSWTVWVFDGESVRARALTRRRPLAPSDLPHLDFVGEVFLPELRVRGGLDPQQEDLARYLIRELTGESMGRALHAPSAGGPATEEKQVVRTGLEPGSARPHAAATYSPSPPSESATTRIAPRRQPVEPTVRTPGLLSRWWHRSGESVRSDLALHGVAYLGVLLFFVGAFGLVAFAFSDVQPRMRPVAEIVIAVVPFGAAALLLRRGAVLVGRALEIAGGLLLPVMAITSLLDGVGFPPDLTGTGLGLALTAICGLLTGAYATWSLRQRESALRYLVAPMAWLTAAMASLGLGRPIPSGEAVAVPGSAQVAATLAVLVVTVAGARRAPRAHLSVPTCIAAVPGSFILGLLAVLTWVAEPDPWPAAILSAGALGVVAIGMLSSDEPPGNRFSPTWSAVIEPAWWATAATATAVVTGTDWAFVAGAVGFVALIELAGRRRRPEWALAIPAVGAVGFTAALLPNPWLATWVLTAASAWALLRRRVPFSVPGAPIALDVAAGVLPVGALAALAGAWEPAAAILVGAGLLVPATAAARRGADPFWGTAWPWWLLTVGAAAALSWGAAASSPGAVGSPWLLVASVAVLTGVVALGPLSGTVRTWSVVALGSWTWLIGCWAGAISDVVRGAVLSLAALALIGAAHTSRLRDPRTAADVGLSGHALAVLALTVAGVEWGFVASLALFTIGWATTAFADAVDRSPVGRRLADVDAALRYVPPALFSLGTAGTVLAALRLAAPDAWDVAVPVALSGIALAMAIATRPGLSPYLRRTFAWVAFGLPIAAVLVTGSAWPRVVALAALICVVIALNAQVRWQVMTWTAWAAPAPLVALVATESWPAFADQPQPTQASLALVAVGSVLLLGAAAADLRSGRWVPHWRPRTPALVPPAAVGALEFVAGLALLADNLGDPLSGWVLVVAAGVLLVLGLLSRVGSLAGIAAVTAWVGAQVILDPDPVPPLIAVVAIAILLGLAELGHRLAPEPGWWSRWDAALALATVPVAIVAVGSAWDTAEAVATDVLVGLIALVAAARLRTMPWVSLTLATVGTALILVGAQTAGPWWFAAAVCALAVTLTVAAAWTSGTVKLTLQGASAAAVAAAWASVARAAEWSADTATSLTLWAGGLLCLGLAAGTWTSRFARSWLRIWGGLSAAAVVVLAAASWGGAGGLQPTVAVVAGLALLTAALLLGAPALQTPWLRDVASMTGLAAALSALRTGNATPAVWVLTLAAVSAAAAICTLLVGPVARRMTIEVGVGAAAIALAFALGPSAAPSLMVTALAAASWQAAAVGSALRSLPVQVLSPVFACAAWLAFVVEIAEASVELWTIPIGFTLLVVVGLWRHDRIRRARPVASADIVVVEVVGVVLLVGASLVLSVTESLVHVLPALALGAGVCVWGALTRVRRRALMGAAVVVTATLLLVAVPLVRLLPEWQSAGLWILLVGLGITALLVAALLERGRAMTRTAVRRFNQLTAGWE